MKQVNKKLKKKLNKSTLTLKSNKFLFKLFEYIYVIVNMICELKTLHIIEKY